MGGHGRESLIAARGWLSEAKQACLWDDKKVSTVERGETRPCCGFGVVENRARYLDGGERVLTVTVTVTTTGRNLTAWKNE